MSCRGRTIVLIWAACGGLMAVRAAARTITAASCSPQDVQAAIDAASDGDTVAVPPGTATWRTSRQNRPAVVISRRGREKQITLKGAGMGKTIITDATGPKCFQTVIKSSEQGIYSDVREKPLRITGFTFRGEGGNALISLSGYTCWRIDHCRFENSGRSLWVSGFGLVDHCIFDKRDNGQSIFVSHQGFAGKQHGDGSWSSLLELGTDRAVYIEDCTFRYYAEQPNAALDGCNGARVVFRHNTLIDAHIASHGTESGGRNRSIRSYEIYANRWHLDRQKQRWTAIFLRGGTGVVFDNRVTGPYGSFALATNYRSSAAYAPWGKCDGSSRWDGNQEPNGYPAIDQIGRSTDSGPGTPQELDPLREWDNTLNGKNADIAVRGTGAVHLHIKAGRDFLKDAPRPSYVPYAYPHRLTHEDTAKTLTGP